MVSDGEVVAFLNYSINFYILPDYYRRYSIVDSETLSKMPYEVINTLWYLLHSASVPSG